jgi:L-asparaginase II
MAVLYLQGVGDYAQLATVTRNSLPDTLHYGAACVADADGKVIWSIGGPDSRAFFRSSSKPMQALAALPAARAFGFDEAELAILCGSHEGGLPQTRQVRGMLDKIGLKEADLLCGNGLADNCSGKHAGMLAACRHAGHPIENYCDTDHPLQRAILRIIADYCGLPTGDILPGLDGCTAPTFNLPLRNMARGFARMGLEAAAAETAASVTTGAGMPGGFPGAQPGQATASAPPGGPATQGGFSPASNGPAILFRAMLAHPGGHTGEPDVRPFPVGGSPPLTKGGANGLLCAALPGLGLGFALKVADGTGPIRWPVFLTVLERAGLLASGDAARMRLALTPPVATRRGAPTGEIVLAF